MAKSVSEGWTGPVAKTVLGRLTGSAYCGEADMRRIGRTWDRKSFVGNLLRKVYFAVVVCLLFFTRLAEPCRSKAMTTPE